MTQDSRLIPPDHTPLSPFLDYEGETEGGVGETLLGSTTRIPMRQIAEWDLDWDAYREEFDKVHGGQPVQIDEWLVWEDGWRCDAYDPGGTEMPPPEEPHKLRELKLSYYQARLAVTKTFRDSLRSRIETIESIQAHKDMPLQMRSVSWSRNVGEDGFDTYMPQASVGKVDLSDPKRAAEDLERNIAHCEERIRELTDSSISKE